MRSATLTRPPADTRPAWARANGRCLGHTLAGTRCKSEPRKGHGTCQLHRYDEGRV